MAQNPRVVAELGRPETPDETSARKAASSFAYRSSQTTRNLIAALLVTLAIVVVIVFAVPRGTPPAREPIDVATIAAQIASAETRTVIVPDAPDEWTINRARVEGDSTRAWTIVYAPELGFVNIAQGFDADASWPTRVLSGASADEAVTIDGIEWTRYDIADPSRAGNVSRALSTPAGTDTILIYGGGIDTATLEQAAASVTGQVQALREEAP
ncbi:DUF4245 domain-containing protein [Microbacterium lacus]|uniref:DUF4245 family protein n=1 Tax=Microbacterium lacus TaxID=415217 RepID=UPI00384DA33A